MDQIITNVRRRKWLEIINACNASGLTRKAWCEQNGIKLKSFYYWQRQLRRDAYDAQANAVSLTAASEVSFAEVTLPETSPVTCHSTDFHPDAVIRTRTLTIEVSNSASAALLSFLGSVMKNVT